MSKYVEVRGVKIGEGVPKSVYRLVERQKKKFLQQQDLLRMLRLML